MCGFYVMTMKSLNSYDTTCIPGEALDRTVLRKAVPV